MKITTLSLFFSQLVFTIKRFPFAIAAAVTATIFCILLSHFQYNSRDTHHWYLNIVMSCYIAMLLQIAITGYCERNKIIFKLKFTLQIMAIAVVVAYYYSLPEKPMEISNIRFLLIILGLHLLIAFIPFTAVNEMNGFWQYNKIIFLRIITTALYTGVLYMGLALALLAVDKLFSVSLNYKLYSDLWFILIGIFHTLFFLSGFPAQFASLEQEKDYPKGLQIFTQYVLLPILIIYLLILYTYTFKILFTLHWPVGWVSYLVLGFSIAGIFSLLLIHPIRNEGSNKWILTFSRFFYFALLALLILLFFAIEKRVTEYGITELRYFVMLLAIWLLFIATYFLVSEQKNIKIIPQSLCLMAFGCSFGPWGAFSVSLRSQQFHLEKIMERNNLLVNGRFIKANKSINLKDRKQISSITAYINEKHGLSYLQPYFEQNLDSIMKQDSVYIYKQTEKILALINIKYAYENVEIESNTRLNYGAINMNEMINVNGFDYYIGKYCNRVNDSKVYDTSTYHLDKDYLRVVLNSNTNNLSFILNNEEVFALNMTEELKHLEQHYGMENYKLPDSVLTFKGSNSKYEYKLILSVLDAKKDKDALHIINTSGKLLIAKKK